MSPANDGWNRELGTGRWSRNGREAGPGYQRPRPPRDGAWARRLEEIRAERETQMFDY